MWGVVVGKKREALREACLEVCVPREGAKLEDELADASDPYGPAYAPPFYELLPT